MDGTIGTLTRRTRAVAVVAALLCLFALSGPTLARQAGSDRGHLHAVKIVALAGTDQFAGNARVDHPVVGPVAVRSPASSVRVVEHNENADGRHDPAASTTPTRGPPGRS